MRVAMATMIALFVIALVDQEFNNARYTRAATAMLSHIVRSFG